jgi:hypothetical protein
MPKQRSAEQKQPSKLDSVDEFKVYCKTKRLVLNRHNASLWDAAVKVGVQIGWDARKEIDLKLAAIYTAPIHAGVDGNTVASEIYDSLNELA